MLKLDSSGTGSPSLSLKQALSCSYLPWRVPLGLSSILLCRVLLTTQQLFSDIRGAREKPFPQSHDTGISATQYIAEQLLQNTASVVLSRDFAMWLYLMLIMSKDLSVPSLFALSRSILFHKYVIDCASAMHAVRYTFCRASGTNPGPVGSSEWNTVWRGMAESRSMAA